MTMIISKCSRTFLRGTLALGRNRAVLSLRCSTSSIGIVVPSRYYHCYRALASVQPGRLLLSSHFSTVTEDKKPKNGNGTFMAIPPHRAHKVCTAEDAVSLISSGDTICVSGFVGQGSPDKILHALSKRYEEEHKTKDEGTTGTKSGAATGLHNLTLLFGGGPGDWDGKGLNYLGNASSNPEAPPLIRRSIGSHYGQVPKLANLVTSNQVEAWACLLYTSDAADE